MAIHDLRSTWSELKDEWERAEARAVAIGPDGAGARIGDEWSFSETLRHLIFVTEAWVGRAVLGQSQPHQPMSLPPDFLADVAFAGIHSSSEHSLDEVIAARRSAQAAVDALLDGLDDDGLAASCPPNSAPGFPPIAPDVTVGRCLEVVLREERAHLGFALRDLEALEVDG